MAIKIITDSSANIKNNAIKGLSVVPLEIRTDEKTFCDNEQLNVDDMIAYFKRCRLKSSTACPSAGDYLEAFGNYENIIVISLTSKLSGSFNAAMIARGLYLQEHPDRRVFVLDTLSAGPEVGLIVKKACSLAEAGVDFDSICNELVKYQEGTALTFSLASLHNFAANGRVNPALAKAIEILNFKIVGRASRVGDLEPIEKCRGQKCSLVKIINEMEDRGYKGGTVFIHHTNNEDMAKRLREILLEKYPNADIEIDANRGLVAYYVEEGGVLVGYEK